MTGSSSTPAVPERAPTVLAVLVVRDAEPWLHGTLDALAAQTYPRLGLVAIDDGSRDRSRQILMESLGDGRVRSREEPGGFADAVQEVLRQPGAARADFLLILRDDAVLDDDAVQRMVSAAVGIRGVTNVGIVGGKVVDARDPRLLVDVGRSADRLGHPSSPLQAGEIDQGQFDRVLEVLAVHGAAMLVAREAWQQVGTLDERLVPEHADLDLCWRARVRGFRVVMTPLARIRLVHEAGRRRRSARGDRYEEDRTALVAMSKNYGWRSLLLYLPLALALSAVRVAYLVLTRRFDEALDVARAWWWAVAHAGGTWSRRRAVQRRRPVSDRSLRRFTQSATLRLPRWFQAAEQIWEEQLQIDAEDEAEAVGRRLRDRTASLVTQHPVIVGAFLAIVVGWFATRHLTAANIVVGGEVPRFPASASTFFGELTSPVRSTGFGGSIPASPALGVLGLVSTALLGGTGLAQKVVLAAGPALAAVLAYRAAVRLTGRPGPSVLAAAAYGLSAVMLWSFSEGRIGSLVGLAALPPLMERLEVAFAPAEPVDGAGRLAAGLAVTIALAVAFEPGVLLAMALVVAVQAFSGGARRRGLRLVGGATVGAAVLLFPFVPALVAGGGRALGSSLFPADVAALARLVLGAGPGTWVVAALALLLAWASGNGYLPAALANAPVYVGLAATAEAFLVAFGLASVMTGLGRESFGLRQIATGLLVAVVVGGIALQAIGAMVGGWAVGGPTQVPAAWAVVGGETGAFRVLWIGADNGQAFPAPGGDPVGVVDAGAASLRYSVTDRSGTSALDIGRPLAGPGDDALREALAEILSGTTAHGGALLAPFGVRFLVAREGDVPAAARERLRGQLDLDVEPVSGLTIFRNAAALPPAAVVPADAQTVRRVRSGTPLSIASVELAALPMREVADGWDGTATAPGLALLAVEADTAWRLEGSNEEPVVAFGWSTSFGVQPGSVRIRHGGDLSGAIDLLALAGLWVVALWVTRRPVAR